jgi:hypothetical protein
LIYSLEPWTTEQKNKRLKKKINILKREEAIYLSTDAALKDAALATATAERYLNFMKGFSQ